MNQFDELSEQDKKRKTSRINMVSIGHIKFNLMSKKIKMSLLYGFLKRKPKLKIGYSSSVCHQIIKIRPVFTLQHLKLKEQKRPFFCHVRLTGNSIAHYLIVIINFIIYSQEDRNTTAVLLATVDFSKAFNHQNHNILIRNLSDIGVPGWLLNFIIVRKKV